MAKRRSTALAPATLDAERVELRAFAEFCETHDARALAACVTTSGISRTLVHVTRLEQWFKQYRTALRQRQPQ